MEGFDAVADGLYGLPPRDFVPARDSAAARAREAGDRPLAARIKALRRPTLAAFAVNRLVRSRQEEVGQLLELGRSLREAQASLAGPALRELSARRHRLVPALTARARDAAADEGEHLGEAHLREVEQTLRAALASEEASAALAGGRLTGALDETGALDGLPPSSAEARTPAPAKAPTPAKAASARAAGESARRAATRQARRAVTEAEAALTAGERERTAARRAAERLERQADRLGAATRAAAEEAAAARAALERAEQELADAREGELTAVGERDAARRRAAGAGAAAVSARGAAARGRARRAVAEPQERGGGA
ncbi:hypothetical protein, partial [Kitasatospora sp. NPDC059571]|uniref:hypothetical protein n=1 Tax=Kitasatospora sp. NPDC059571 TaxID=3346871 RepID=UPI0036A8ECA9